MFILYEVVMFVSLSAEYIVIYTQDEKFIIPFQSVEEDLTATLIRLYRDYKPSVICVLNWPWSFTNLRVGALVVNMILLLSKGECKLQSIDKLSLYRYAFLQGFLPRYGYLFIWQRKNIWYYDFETETYEVYKKTDPDFLSRIIPTDWSESLYFVDTFIGEDFDFFHQHPGMISLQYEDNNILLQYSHNEQFDCTHIFENKTSLEPFYGMEPNIG